MRRWASKVLGVRAIRSRAKGIPSSFPTSVMRRSSSATTFSLPNLSSRYSLRAMPSFGIPGLSWKGFQWTRNLCLSLAAARAFSSRFLPTKHQGQIASDTTSMSMTMDTLRMRRRPPLFSERGRSRLLREGRRSAFFPARAEGFDELDHRDEPQAGELGGRKLVSQERALGVDHLEVADQALLVLRLGQAQVFAGRIHRLVQRLRGIRPQMKIGQGVLDVAIGRQHLAAVDGQKLRIAPAGLVHGRVDTAAFEDRLGEGGADGPDAALPVQEMPEIQAFPSRRSRQLQVRIVLRDGYPDLSARRGQVLLGFRHIRAAPQELRGQACGDCRQLDVEVQSLDRKREAGGRLTHQDGHGVFQVRPLAPDVD